MHDVMRVEERRELNNVESEMQQEAVVAGAQIGHACSVDRSSRFESAILDRLSLTASIAIDRSAESSRVGHRVGQVRLMIQSHPP